MEWPSEADFYSKSPQIIKWRELPQGIFKLAAYKEVTTQYGSKLILTLKTKQDETFTVWALARLETELRALKMEVNFINNIGMCQTGNDKYPLYYDFQLI